LFVFFFFLEILGEEIVQMFCVLCEDFPVDIAWFLVFECCCPCKQEIFDNKTKAVYYNFNDFCSSLPFHFVNINWIKDMYENIQSRTEMLHPLENSSSISTIFPLETYTTILDETDKSPNKPLYVL
jgi:hypothetical protein